MISASQPAGPPRAAGCSLSGRGSTPRSLPPARPSRKLHETPCESCSGHALMPRCTMPQFASDGRGSTAEPLEPCTMHRPAVQTRCEPPGLTRAKESLTLASRSLSSVDWRTLLNPEAVDPPRTTNLAEGIQVSISSRRSSPAASIVLRLESCEALTLEPSWPQNGPRIAQIAGPVQDQRDVCRLLLQYRLDLQNEHARAAERGSAKLAWLLQEGPASLAKAAAAREPL